MRSISKLLLTIALMGMLVGVVLPYLGFLPNYARRVTAPTADLYRSSGLEKLAYRARTWANGGPPALPGEAAALFQHGLQAGKSGDWRAAAALFDEAGERAPYDTGLHYARSRAHQLAGNSFAAALHLAIFTTEDETRGRAAVVVRDLKERLRDLETEAAAILRVAWSVADTLPPDSKGRAAVLRAAALAPATRTIADPGKNEDPPTSMVFLAQVAAVQPWFAVPVVTAAAVDLQVALRLDEMDALFRLSEAASAPLATQIPDGTTIDRLCAAARPAPNCRSITTHNGVAGLPPVVEKQCERSTPIETLRKSETIQLYSQLVLVIGYEKHRAGKIDEGRTWWNHGNGWLGDHASPHFCPLPLMVHPLRPLPAQQGSGRGWPFDRRIFDDLQIVPPRDEPWPSAAWDALAVDRVIKLPHRGALYLGGHRRGFDLELKDIEMSDDVEHMPERIAAIAVDYLWLYHLLVPHYWRLSSIADKSTSPEGTKR